MMSNINGVMKAFIILITGLIILGGCTPQKKIIPPSGPDPVPPDKVPRMFVKPTPQKAPRLSADVAGDVSKTAQKITGVKRAYTVVLGNAALIGIETGTVNDIAGVRIRVAQMTEKDPRIVKSFVTNDSRDVATIRSISDNINKGKPVTAYLDQINKIIKKWPPQAR